MIQFLNFTSGVFVGKVEADLFGAIASLFLYKSTLAPYPCTSFSRRSKHPDNINFFAACLCYQDIEQCRHTVDNMFARLLQIFSGLYRLPFTPPTA
jgi:hypothetical protein